jgi:lysophospholipase L1-like esterase
MRTRSRRRRLVSLAIGIIGSLVLLEVILQIGHLFVCLSQEHEPIAPIKSTDRVVMCVGDSFTWGIGSSSPENSYPSQLEPMLKDELGPQWRVINSGWPGQNSREALLRLDAQLAAWRPEFVCFVIGINDLWSRPRGLRLPEGPVEDAGSCRLAWRTARLFLLIKNALLGPPPTGVEPTEPMASTGPEGVDSAGSALSVVGSWNHLGQRAVFHEDGTARYEGLDMQWAVDGDQLVLTADDVSDLVLTWHRIGSQLILKPGSGKEMVLQRIEDFVEQYLAASRFAVEDGVPWVGTPLVEQLVFVLKPGDSWEPRVHLAMYRALRAQDRVEEAEMELAWLRDRNEDLPDAQSAGCLLEALVTGGELDEARRLAGAVTATYPDSNRIWRAVALLERREGRTDAARTAIDRAVGLTTGHPRWQAEVHRSRADLYAGVDDKEFSKEILRAYMLDRDRAATGRRLREARSRIGDEVFERSLAESSLDDDAKRELRELLENSDLARTNAVLRSHLAQMIERARAAGAEPVIASYPTPGWSFYPVLIEVANAAGAAWVPLYEEFQRVRAAEPDRELLVPDGHCNDAGYQLMAQVLANTLSERARGR